jgi:hypothetical protein
MVVCVYDRVSQRQSLQPPSKVASLLRLLYATKRMPRRDQPSNLAGDHGSRRGNQNQNASNCAAARRITRNSPNEPERARAPGAPRVQRHSRMDQQASEPLSQLDSIGSPSTTGGTPAVSRRSARGGTPASSAYSAPSSLLEIQKETLQCLPCFVNDILKSGFLVDVTRASLVVKR